MDNCVKLKDRTLWFDGDSTINENEIINLITNNNNTDGIFTEKLSADIIEYNKLVPKNKQILVKSTINDLSFAWNIPEKYKNIDVTKYVMDKLEQNTDDKELRRNRCIEELELYKKLQLFDVLKTLIYIINTLTKNNIIWGVGRGSSVASYVLFLIGVHDVDSFKYELDIKEFLRIIEE